MSHRRGSATLEIVACRALTRRLRLVHLPASESKWSEDSAVSVSGQMPASTLLEDLVGLAGKSRGSLAADHFRRRAAIATNTRANACP